MSLLALALIVVAAAGPVIETNSQTSERQGFDLAICIDLSESMLAEDVSPNRLERAKREISDLLDLAKGDRFALVAYSGVPFLEVPLTLDYSSLRLFSRNLNSQLIPVKGSNLEAALLRSQEALGDPSPNKAILLLSDGEHFKGKLSDLSIPVFVLGVGTTEGTNIPSRAGFKRDKRGQLVETKLEESSLQNIASSTGGTYQRSTASDSDSRQLIQDLKENLKKSSLGDFQQLSFTHLFQYPLALGLLILIFSRVVGHGLLLSLVLLASLFTNSEAHANDESSATEAFENADFEKALELYKGSIGEDGKASSRTLSQIGASAYRSGKFEEAAEYYQKALEKSSDDSEKADLLHNLGAAQVQSKNFKEALTSFEESLKIDPNDKQTTANRDFTKKLIKEEQQKQEKGDGEESDEKSDSEEDGSKQEDSSQSEDSQSEDSQSQDSESDSQQEESPESKQEAGEQKEDSEGQSDEEESKEEDAELTPLPEDGSEGESQEDEPAESTTEEEAKGDQKEGEQQQAVGSSNQEVPTEQSQIETILDSISEDVNRGSIYRSRKALRDLKRRGMRPPERDW